jgi:arylsulfatase A-like enzyme
VNDNRPSIILITADQLRKDALGCYGNQIIQTPNLDQLAASSIQFDRAYTASPWCLPSRCALATGLYPHNNGAYSNFRDCQLDPQIPNLYNTLHAAGYLAAHIGKCHYAPVPYSETRADRTLPYETFRDYYVSLGMDHLALQDDKQVSVWFRDDYAEELDQAGHLEAYRAAVWNRDYRKVFDFPGPTEWHPDSWVGRKATEYVRDYAEERPLFLWASFSGPHFPFDAPADYHSRVDMERLGEGVFEEGEFDHGDKIHAASYHGGGRIEGCGSAPERACKNYTDDYWRDLRRNYFANVALIDDQVGELLAAIHQRFGDNVLVIFTADHGEMLGNHRLWGKHNCGYEDVLNVPLLVRYPGQTEQQRTDAKVMLTDIMATCLKTAQVTDPPRTDGVDFAELVTQGGHPYVFAEGDGFLTVSDGRHKLVRVVQEIGVFHEFHDLAADPLEFHNFAGDPAYAVQQTQLQTVALDFLIRGLLP